MSAASPWLPTNCLVSRQAAAPFERIVDAWAGEWFADTGWRVLGTWDAGGSPDASGWSVSRDAARLRIKVRPHALRSLALAVLGVQEQARYTEQDLRLMRRVAGQAIDDLHARLEDGLGPAPSQPAGCDRDGTRIHTLLIGIVGAAQLAIECTQADLVTIVRGTFPASGLLAALESRGDAYAGRALHVAAHIGEARLSLEQITALEQGDVIMLDRQCDEPVHLMVGEQRTDLSFHLAERGGRVVLEYQDMS